MTRRNAFRQREAGEPGRAVVQWWLAELDRYGNPRLCDGAHSERSGAEKALHIYQGIGLAGTARYAVARVELTEAIPSGAGVNEDAVALCAQVVREARTVPIRTAQATGSDADGP